MMDSAVLTTIVSTTGAVIVGLGGMWMISSQLGKRLDDMGKRIDRMENQFSAFKEVMNGKLSALDIEIAKLLDRPRQ